MIKFLRNGITVGRFLLFLLLLLPQFAAVADEFQINTMEVRPVGDSYVLNATIDYRFSDEALEALENGVPLTLEVHIQLRRSGAWVWENDLLDTRLRYEIRFHALAGLYQVLDLQTEGQENFATRDAALRALGRLIGYPVVQQSSLEAGETYRLALRAVLDIEALPLPLRPIAHLSPDWNLSSEWREWLIRP